MLKHKGTNTIETEKLILRRFKIEDVEGVYNSWVTDCKVTKFLSWLPHENIELTRSYIATWIDEYNDDNRYNWIIELKDEKKVIGNILAVRINESNYSCEMAYAISSKYWNKGITTEALKGVIDYFFREVGFNRIVALYNVNNGASGRVMAKNNMKYEGTFRQDGVSKEQEFYDLVQYAILKEDYTF